MAEWTNVATSMKPPDGEAVPARPEDLTASWLTACLRHDGAIAPAARVASFEQRAIGQGRGFAGRIARVSLRYEPDGAGPPTLVAKFASEHGPTREMLRSIDGYVREVRFYRELAGSVGVSTPRCYFAHYDQKNVACCLLLEDLAPAASADREQGFTVDEARRVLEQLAVMHARYWNRTDEVPWLQLQDELIDVVIQRFSASLPRFVEQWGGAYPSIAAVGQLMLGFLDGSDEVHRQAKRPPLTLTHNDIHIENVMLPTPQGGRLAILDWQSLAFARHGTPDVTRVICVGLRPEVRRAHGSALLDAYHRALVAQGVRGFSRFALGLRFKQEMVAMVLVGVLAFDTLDFGEEGQAAATTLATRIDTAIREARVTRLLRFMGFWLKLKRFFGRLIGRQVTRRLPG